MSEGLLKDVSGGKGTVYRINFSDDESLIHEGAAGADSGFFRRTWRRLVELIKRSAYRKDTTRSGSVRRASGDNATAAATKEAADYQELCRQRAKVSGGSVKGNVSPTIVNERSESPRSSTSSWLELRSIPAFPKYTLNSILLKGVKSL